jgi:hypothetical protein
MGHSILQWSRTLGGNFVSKKGDLGWFEDTLRRVRISHLWSRSKRVGRCCLCSLRDRENEDVMQVSEIEVKFLQSVVHEELKCLRGVA